MNQRGNEPMAILHVRIPCELLERITVLAEQSGISKSEYVRLALEYAQDNELIISKKITYQGKEYTKGRW